MLYSKQLAYFIKAAQLQSITEAAEELRLSQSAVSQQIKALENSLQVKLLDRRKKVFHLTPEGQELFLCAESYIQEGDRITRLIQHMGGVDRNSLRIGYCNLYGGRWLPMMLADFTDCNPSIRLQTQRETSSKLEQGIQDGSLDLALGIWSPNMNQRFQSIPVQNLQLFALVPESLSLSSPEFVTEQDLQTLPLIQAEDGVLSSIFSPRELPTVWADTTGQAKMMVASRSGFLTLLYPSSAPKGYPGCKILPILKNGQPILFESRFFYLPDTHNLQTELFLDYWRQHFTPIV